MESLPLILLSSLVAFASNTLAEETQITSSGTTFKTSVVQATRTETHTSIPSASGGGGGYGSYGSNAVDTEGGASGTSSDSFNLSKGALIAIIVVVVTVAVFGIASVVLYILAKRRQWNIRQSIKRASRRLTGRTVPPTAKEEAARRKRSGVIAGSKSSTRAAHPPGQKRGVVVEVKDEEKGPLDYSPPPTMKKPKEDTFAGRLKGNNWK